MEDSDQPTQIARPPRAGCLFQLTALIAGLFAMTVLAMIATTFGDAESPLTKWLNRNSIRLIAVEVVAILLIGIAAMIQDRCRTLREQREQRSNTGEPVSGEVDP